MTPMIRVGGVWLHSRYPVSDVVDSTIWRTQGFSGDYELEFTFGAPAGFSAPWFRPGATTELFVDGFLSWRGVLGDRKPGDNGWDCVAFGDGSDTANFRSTVSSSASVDSMLASATSAGMRWARGSDTFVPAVSFTVAPTDIIQLDTLMDRCAAALGKVWYVTRGYGWPRSPSSSVDWVMTPDSTYLGVADEEYVTSLTAVYATAADTAGNPTAVAYTTPTEGLTLDSAAAARMGGPREATVDLTALGVLSGGNAAVIAASRFAQVGARAGFTNAFVMTALNSRRASNGVPAPMSVRAGHRIRVPGVTDMVASSTFGTSVTVTAGKVTRNHAEQTVTVEPLGLVDRDFSGALSAASRPPDLIETV